MSNQNITTDLLIELSSEEQQLLSGGCDNYEPLRRRRGGIRQKVENNPVFSPVINIYPSETRPADDSDISQSSSDSQDKT
ncbi:hypothetical protein [Dolichospermum circinale]|uniref:hypothetical protein n=1 Tax=Dolichospermum circinale TaxID=109265 RepID=UPI0004867C14|nr:hypothetical protein [Dolichospermum circinale]MDB9474856.1 hypothetical protein [Dolichospermum circinale CS-537/11]MDB9478592.1 hypothetical protein [Dolichospermum circinale CS-537/03]MDB9484203.1 hypothetical protein [Dolichospermum circinale CS-537/05]